MDMLRIFGKNLAEKKVGLCVCQNATPRREELRKKLFLIASVLFELKLL